MVRWAFDGGAIIIEFGAMITVVGAMGMRCPFDRHAMVVRCSFDWHSCSVREACDASKQQRNLQASYTEATSIVKRKQNLNPVYTICFTPSLLLYTRK
ncbi:MAG: hypothetical protein ACKVOQ_04255 [Cyclobacteriaceae bacterium]